MAGIEVEYSIAEKVTLAAYAITLENIEECRRLFNERFNKEAPSRSTIKYWKLKILETGSLKADRPKSGRPRTVQTDDNKENIRNAVTDNACVSTRCLADNLDISQRSVLRILHSEKMKPFKPNYGQLLYDGDEDRRVQFCELMTGMFNNDPAMLRKITFSDECCFHLDSTVNKHNIHFWGLQKPDVTIGKPVNTMSLTVWACIGFRGLIDYDISPNTMNGESYCEILQQKVVPYFQRRHEMWYQQDGAPPHFCLRAREILNTELAGRWIGRRGAVDWPARSPDLTACDYWLWSYLRQKVYTPGVVFPNRDALQQRIIHELESIPLEMYRKSIRNFQERLRKCIANQGGYFE